MTASTSRTRLMGLGLLAAVFVVGALSGAAVDRALDTRDGGRAEARRDDARRDSGRRRYVFEELDLTADQRARIDSVLEARRMQISAFWDSAGPRMQEIVDSTRAGIRGVLTAEQREEYERLLNARRRDDDRGDDDRRDDGRRDDDRRDDDRRDDDRRDDDDGDNGKHRGGRDDGRDF